MCWTCTWEIVPGALFRWPGLIVATLNDVEVRLILPRFEQLPRVIHP